VSQEGSSRVTSHAPKSAKECEGMNLHTPKWTLIMGVRVQNGFPNFHRAIVGVKIQWIETFLILLESSWNVDVWNVLTWPIWTSKTQVVAKIKVGSQIGNLIPDH
jgi:hypothetical protein